MSDTLKNDPDFGDALSREDQALKNYALERRGFWLCVSGVSPEPADQTFESLCEVARFYPSILPPDFRSRLAQLDQMGAGREEPFCESFREAYGALAGRHDGVKGIARRRRRFEAAEGFKDGNLRDLVGLSFVHYRHDTGAHWGGLLVMFDASIFLASGHDRMSKTSDLTYDLCTKASLDLSSALIDELAFRWKLPPAMACHQRDEARIHWGEHWPPSAMDASVDAEALRALAVFEESVALGLVAAPALPALPGRTPRSI